MKIISTVSELIKRNLWNEYCEDTGTNPWAVSEGLMKEDTVVEWDRIEADPEVKQPIILDKPELLKEPDISSLKEEVRGYVLDDDCDHQDCDCSHYIFEEAIKAFFGQNIWDYINNKNK